jgi:hypothetical protein
MIANWFCNLSLTYFPNKSKLSEAIKMSLSFHLLLKIQKKCQLACRASEPNISGAITRQEK